jgi:hypothetical protein
MARQFLVMVGVGACLASGSCTTSSATGPHCDDSFVWRRTPYYSARTMGEVNPDRYNFSSPQRRRVDAVSPLPRGDLLGTGRLITCEGSIQIYQIVGVDPEQAVVTRDGTVFIGKRAGIPPILLSPTAS